jgi:hypothetical protein
MSSYIIKGFEERIKEAVNDKAKLRAAVLSIQKYFDANHAIIFDSSPAQRLIFAVKDQNVVFDLTDIAPEEVSGYIVSTLKDNVKEFGYVNKRGEAFVLLNDPFTMLSWLVIRELTIQKKDTEAQLFIMYLSMKFFSSRQRRSWQFPPNPQIMAYTMNNLSNKFKYKQLQNNYNVIKDTVMTSHETYKRILTDGTDEAYLTYIPQMENRIGKIINGIAEEYYDNRDKKNYLNTEKSFDDKDEMVDKTNLSDTIHQLAQSVVHDYVSMKINMGLTKLVSNKNNLPFMTVYQALNEIRIKENPETLDSMLRMLFNIISDADPQAFEKVCSSDFITMALRQISISNTTNQDLIQIKVILDKFLMLHCSKYAATNRIPTKMAYRNAVYSYFVYLIVLHKCR